MSKGKIFGHLLVLALFFAAFFYLLRHQDLSLRDLATLNRQGLLAWLLLLLMTWWINAEKLRTLLEPYGHRVPLFELFQLGMATSLFNYLPLQAGAAARGLYLKRRLNLAPTQFISLTASIYLVMVLTQSFAGMLLCIPRLHEIRMRGLFFLFFIPFAISLLLAVIEFPRPLRERLAAGRLHFLVVLHDEFLELTHTPRNFVKLSLWEIASLAVEALRIQVIFYLLGLAHGSLWTLSTDGALLMAALTLPTVLLNLTPAGIGIRESAMALVAVAFGFPVSQAFLAAGLDRLLTLLTVFSLGSIASWRLLHRFRKAIPAKT